MQILMLNTDDPHLFGARLVFVTLAGYIKIHWSAQQFRAEIRHRTLPQSLDNPANELHLDE
jgi:hypothetical protein